MAGPLREELGPTSAPRDVAGLALIIGPHPRPTSVHVSTPPVLSLLVSIVVSISPLGRPVPPPSVSSPAVGWSR